MPTTTLTLCERRCSAVAVRCLPDGTALCCYHWSEHHISLWAALCPDTWHGERVCRVMEHTPRPLTAAQVAWQATARESEHCQHEEDQSAAALDALVEAGVLATIAPAADKPGELRYTFSWEVIPLLGPYNVGPRRHDGVEWG